MLRRHGTRLTAAALLSVLAVGSVAPTVDAAPRAPRPEPVTVPGSDLPGPGAFEGPVRQLAVNGITIGYRQFGSGPDLLLITGQTGTMSTWVPGLLEALARDFRVTIFDNRGVGYSTDDPAAPLTIKLMARDTAALIRALRIEPANIVGWSMGGEIGLTLAVDSPRLVRTLVTTGATAGGPKTILPSPEIVALIADPNADPLAVLNALFPPEAAAAKQAFLDGYLSIPQEAVSAETVRRQAEAEDEFEMRDTRVFRRLPRVRVPVLVTNGAEDVVVDPQNARTIADRIPGAQLVLFEGCGHAMLFHDQDRFVSLVHDFVTKRRGSQ